MVDSVNLGNALINPSSTDESVSKFAKDFDDFLKLLVTQLKNQNPLEPLDSNEFTDQIVQFTGVEQSINTNQKLDALLGITQLSNNSDIISFAGKQVEVEGSTIVLPEDGEVSFAYNIDESQIKKTFVTIRDAFGNTVFNGEGSTSEGKHFYSWNGVDNSGNQSSPGAYHIQITTENSDGNINNISSIVQGVVEGVNLVGSEPTLVVNGEEIPLGKVNFIGESAT